MAKLIVLAVTAYIWLWKSSAVLCINTPPHTLFNPQVYHVGVQETLSFTSYSFREFDVIATVYYDNCGRSNEVVFHTAMESAMIGHPVSLTLQMPSWKQLEGRRYYIKVTSHNDTVTYLRRRIHFSTSSFGFLFVKTNKPIYKPSQTVEFCLAQVDKNLKPYADDVVVKITVRDATYKKVMQWDNETILSGDLLCLKFPLSDELNFGTWSIDADVLFPNGACSRYYGTPRSSCSFKVEEFVLPKFEVTLSVPKQLQKSTDFVEGFVDAKYTFGSDVQGMIKINATLKSSRRSENLVFFERFFRLRNGRYTFRIASEEYRRLVRYRYDPFCVKSTILITAEVVEDGRGTKISDSANIPLVFSPIDVAFADDNPSTFKPGLTYTVKAVAKLGDGSPATSVGVRVIASINNEKQLLHDNVITSTDEDGLVTASIEIPTNAKCLKLTLAPELEGNDCDLQEKECFSPSPLYSPTNSFLQLQHVSTESLKPGSSVEIQATSTVPFTYLHVLVISQGSIQEIGFNFTDGGTTSTIVSFNLSFATTPNIKVLGIFAREDGELVADLIALSVSCELENEVNVVFNETSVEPGDPISITTTASSDSVILLSVIDKSLTLLAESCKSLEKDNVCQLLRSLTQGSLSVGKSCGGDSVEGCCPSSCSEPTRYGVNTILNAAGVTLNSNMFRPNPPYIPPPRTTYNPFSFNAIPGRGAGDFGQRGIPGPQSLALPAINIEPDEIVVEDTQVRTFFPESWIFSLLRTSKSGQVQLDSTAPDTITTWNAEAIALNGFTGLGISQRAQLTVAKNFFVSLELPYSVNFGETVTIIPLVFYFGSETSILVSYSVQVDDDLSVLSEEGESGILSVSSGESSSFQLKLKPRAIGQLFITISAGGLTGGSDVVKKFLFVKPGCEKFEDTQNILAEENGEHCFNYSLPTCVVPGSASAIITVTGDVMSTPPNLHQLLVLPSGCGEQNLVKTAVNWLVAEYLNATEQLLDFTAVKIKNNIQIGYQSELTFLQRSGCFSVWPTSPCSLWLTASVVNIFSGIVQFYRELEPGTQIVDDSVINGALNYVINNQQPSGKIPVIGRVHRLGLLSSSSQSVAHTAFGVVALKKFVAVFKETAISHSTNAVRAIENAESYLSNTYTSLNQFCNYDLALTSYALQVSTPTPNGVIGEMLYELKLHITESKSFPGTCFICQECPGSSDSSSQKTDCLGRSQNERSSACVETSSYALLALLEAEDTEHTVCLAQWLVKIRGSTGGFYSSQDTVVALQALGSFEAKRGAIKQLNKTVTINIPGLSQLPPLTFNNENRFQRIETEISSIPSNNNCITWNGSGTVLIQSTHSYHGCDCCSDTRSFSLELTVNSRDRILALSVTIQYLSDGVSNMAIVDVESPSGYIYSTWRFQDESGSTADLERVERKGSNVVFYFNEVPSARATSFIVEFVEVFAVEDSQQLPVVVYDYYDPGQTVTKYYVPNFPSALPEVPPNIN